MTVNLLYQSLLCMILSQHTYSYKLWLVNSFNYLYFYVVSFYNKFNQKSINLFQKTNKYFNE